MPHPHGHIHMPHPNFTYPKKWMWHFKDVALFF